MYILSSPLLVYFAGVFSGILIISLWLSVGKNKGKSNDAKVTKGLEQLNDDDDVGDDGVVDSEESGEEGDSESDDTSSVSSEEDDPKQRLKLVLVVRTDLDMTKGKICAQCSHATLGAYKDIIKKYNKSKDDKIAKLHVDWLKRWQITGCAKIVVKAKNLEEINELKKNAKEYRLPYNYVIDAGRTQIPSNSLTVLAVGPGPTQLVDNVTGKQKLL